jgi:WhiB family redox-sensing transcriptional regulator
LSTVESPPEHRAPNDSAVRNAEAWGWQLLARCRGIDPAVFFHPDGERGLKRRQRQQNAKRFCAECPVVMDCREHSLRFQEPYGIWGGIAEDERRKILERSRGLETEDHQPTGSSWMIQRNSQFQLTVKVDDV